MVSGDKELSHKKFHRYLVLLLTLGLLIRIAWLRIDPHEIIYDEVSYHGLATSLAQGQAYGAPFWPPGYPMTLALAYALFGPTPRVAIVLNLVLSLCTLVLAALVAKKLFGTLTAILSLLIMALMPSYILTISLVRYEVLLQFCLVLTLWLSLYRWRWMNMLGIAFFAALATLMRPLMIFWPFVLWLINVSPDSRKVNAKRMLIIQGLSVLLILPWIAYASSAAGRFVPVALNGGVNLWIGNNPNATGAYMTNPPEFWGPENEAAASRAAIQYILDHPLQTILLLPNKVGYSLVREHWPADLIFEKINTGKPFFSYASLVIVSNVYYVFVSCMAMVSILILLRRKSYRQLSLLLLLLYSIAGQLPFFGSPRFRWITQFVLIFYAAALLPLLLPEVQSWVRNRRSAIDVSTRNGG